MRFYKTILLMGFLGSAAVAQIMPPMPPLSAEDQALVKQLQEHQRGIDEGRFQLPPEERPPMTPPAAEQEAAAALAEESRQKALDLFPKPPDPVADVTTYVFVSLGMPESVLKKLFQQAKDRKDVAFVLRGWTPPNFTQMGLKVISLMPDKTRNDQVNVIVDPLLFRGYHIDRAPVFLHHSKRHGWRRLSGEISLDGAIEQIEKGRYNQVVGNLYAIKEPDILEVIEQRMAEVNWDGVMKSAHNRAINLMPQYELPVAERDDSRLVDLTIRLSADITDHEGRIVAPSGTAVNPLDYVALPEPILVFDPSVERQMKWIRSELAARKGGIDPLVLATHLPAPDEKTGKSISDDFGGIQVYPLNAELVTRLQIRSTPSVIEQEGVFLRVKEKRL